MKLLSFPLNQDLFNVWYLEGPKNAPVIHWAHANGLNAQTYSHLLHNLSSNFSVYAWDARLHGLTQAVQNPCPVETYDAYTTDLVRMTKLLSRRHDKRIILAGHSFGATLCLKAEEQLHKVISKIILADPVLYTPMVSFLSKLGRFLKLKQPELYLSQKALYRRNQWKNRSEVYESYSKKKIFRNWSEQSLKNYINYGTNISDAGFKLSCPPNLESEIFKAAEVEFLSSQIKNLKTETFIYFAEKGSPSFAKKTFNRSNFVKNQTVITRSNHFFPIESPTDFAEMIIKDCL